MYTTDGEWENLGKENPYFGVLTDEKYKSKNLNEDLKREFFLTGETYVNSVFSIIETVTQKQFKPKRSLDFGCGVGRLTIPIAKRSDYATGLDVSKSILQEAQKNAEEIGLTNIDFKEYSDAAVAAQKFDFINTFIVLQHIPVKRGTEIIKVLVNALDTDGIALLHITFDSLNDENLFFRKRLNYLRGVSPLFNNFTKVIRKMVKGIALSDPIIQMNYYNLNTLFKIIYNAQGVVLHNDFTNHAGVIGCMLYIKKVEHYQHNF